MLADVLDGARDQLADELERRAAVTEPTELPTAARRKRLSALVEEVIAGLRDGDLDHRPPLIPAFPDLVLDLAERDLVKHYLLEQIEQRRLEASPREAALVAEWGARAERERLREQSRRLGVLLDGMDEAATLFGSDGRILYCNLRARDGLQNALGSPRQEIVGKTPAEIGVPSEHLFGRPIDELTALARAHESFEVSIRGRLKEGHFEAVYGPDGGAVDAVALVVRDIHDRKLAQIRLGLLAKLTRLVGLADSDELAEALVHVPVPEFADWCFVNLVDRGRVLRTFAAHRDPSKAQLRDALLDALPAWDRHPLWQEMLLGGFQLLAEVSDNLVRRVVPNDELYRLIQQLGIRSLLVVPLVARGRVAAIVTCLYTTESGRRYGRDDPALGEELALHASHSFENARLMSDLKSSEARFRIALAGARTAVYEQETSLRYVWCYDPMSHCNIVGKTDEESFPADEAALLSGMKKRALERGETVQEEIDLSVGGDERRHYREAIEPLRDHTGRIIGVIGAATDITEQQRTQQQLADELAFREKMMGILGHDLRSPITTIAMTGDLLLRRQDLSPGEREQVLRIRRVAGRMREMIDTLLDFTRVRFLGKVPLAPVPADLAEIARSAVDELRVAWPGQAIELDVRGDARGEWDPGRMWQTISNLVGNAISYGQQGTPVRLSVGGEERDVELEVHNEGPPIPPEVLPMLFQPFRRGVVEDQSPWGLGLGLFIVQQIVLAHDGTIAVDSSARDGTTFKLRLPRARLGEAATRT
jgi:signal transduction histidine kinase/GAF domain-containing protein